MAALGVCQPKAGGFLPSLAHPEGRRLVWEAGIGAWWSADGLGGKKKDRPSSGDPGVILTIKSVLGGRMGQTLGGTDEETESLG